MKTVWWIIFLGITAACLIVSYLVINEIITSQTAAIIFFSAISLFGFVFMIISIRDSIRFHKALKDYQKELPNMVKAGLITKEDLDKMLNQKFPEIW